jgi:hypothetical protein
MTDVAGCLPVHQDHMGRAGGPVRSCFVVSPINC